MPLVHSETCSACGRAYEAVSSLGFDIDDVAQMQSADPDEMKHLFNDLFGSLGVKIEGLKSEPKYTSGALFHLDIESLSTVGEEQPDRRAWLIRYAISPAAAATGGRFDLCLGKRERGGKELVIQVPPGIRDGTKLRVAGICPNGEDLLIGVEIRERLPEPSLLADVIRFCPACERRSDQTHRADQVRRERLQAMLPQIGAWVGFGLFALLCLAVWACTR